MGIDWHRRGVRKIFHSFVKFCKEDLPKHAATQLKSEVLMKCSVTLSSTIVFVSPQSASLLVPPVNCHNSSSPIPMQEKNVFCSVTPLERPPQVLLSVRNGRSGKHWIKSSSLSVATLPSFFSAAHATIKPTMQLKFPENVRIIIGLCKCVQAFMPQHSCTCHWILQ